VAATRTEQICLLGFGFKLMRAILAFDSGNHAVERKVTTAAATPARHFFRSQSRPRDRAGFNPWNFLAPKSDLPDKH
jgi:hypothetical protein